METIVLHQILLFEPNAVQRQLLLDLIRASFPEAAVSRCEGTEEFVKQLGSIRPQAAVIGSSLQLDDQLALLDQCAAAAAHAQCAVICAASDTSSELLLQYIRRGAHGLLVPPFSQASLTEAVRAALAVAQKNRQTALEREQVTSLPWILERFSARLDDIAARVKSAQTPDRPIAATPKALKEVLLSIIGAQGHQEEEAVEAIVQMLLRSPDSPDQ